VKATPNKLSSTMYILASDNSSMTCDSKNEIIFMYNNDVNNHCKAFINCIAASHI